MERRKREEGGEGEGESEREEVNTVKITWAYMHG